MASLVRRCRPIPCAGQAQTLVLAGREGTGTVLAPAGGLGMWETTSPSFPQTQWVQQKVQSSASRHVVRDMACWGLYLLAQSHRSGSWAFAFYIS